MLETLTKDKRKNEDKVKIIIAIIVKTIKNYQIIRRGKNINKRVSKKNN